MLLQEKMENSQFSNSEREVIRFILDKKSEIRNMTTKQIAAQAYASPSTLIRIAHKLGFKGWNELKEAYLSELDYLEGGFQDIDANMPFNADDPIMTIAAKIAQLKKESIDDTLSLLNHDDLRKAVRLIEKADVIDIYAVSSNTNLVRSFIHNMSRIRKRVILHDIQGELLFPAALSEANTCAIVISYSGETPILVSVCKALKKNGTPFIGITSLGENTVSKNADVVLHMTTREKLYSKIATFTTDESVMCILDVLYSCFFAIRYESNLALKKNMSREIETGRYSTLSILKEE